MVNIIYIYISMVSMIYKCGEHIYIYIYTCVNLLIALWCMRQSLPLIARQFRSRSAAAGGPQYLGLYALVGPKKQHR